VFAAIVAVVAAFIAWRSRPTVEPVTRSSSASELATPARSAVEAAVVVAVSGRVRHPGLVRLPAGSRVADAIEAAGGALPGTDLSMVNLARKVVDGELIVVGLAATGVSGAAGPGATVNLNTATLDQLQTLPGVGPVLAQRIIDYRNEHGGFARVTDLRQVSGIGDARFNELKDKVSV
jgi:competence protein ComEA